MNPYSPALFAQSIGCLPCCGDEPPTECQCALLIPPNGTPYPTYDDAAAVFSLSLTNVWGICYAYYEATSVSAVITSFTATPGNNSLNVTASETGSETGVQWIYASVTVSDGAILQVDYSGSLATTPTNARLAVAVLSCDWATLVELHEESGTTGSFSLASLPEGTYNVFFGLIADTLDDPESGSVDVTFTATTGSMVTNPVIALWDDSGTTRQLEACPKMLLPPLTESTGTWYADCAAADAILTDSAWVSNCIGYADNSIALTDTFTATGGPSLTFAGAANGGTDGLNCWGSVNVEAGEDIVATFSNSLGGFLAVYDYAGNMLVSGLGAGPLSTGPLPYTGRYIVNTSQSTGVGDPPGNVIVSSSGAMSVNEIQALYDIGLDCPARLNCGDSCP